MSDRHDTTRILELKPALSSLRACIDANGVIDLGDDELIEMAHLCARELVSRLPHYAIEQGDLPDDYEPAATARLNIRGYIEEHEQDIHPNGEDT